YYWALILANFISIIFLLISTRSYLKIQLKYIKIKTIKYLLLFSVPLIRNSLMWWLINASSRYFIRIFVGIASNGLFSVASKIPALISIVNQIFIQAWQLSAIEEYENKDSEKFYSDVF